jgi:hypothetical protein
VKLKVLFLILALAFIGVGCGKKSWQNLDESAFKVEMPGSAAKSNQTVTTAAGPITVNLWTLDQKTEGYIVGYSEYPEAVFNARNPEQLLDSARDGAISNVKGKVTDEKKITQGSFPGREITGNSPDQNVAFTARVFLAKPRMYMLVYSQLGKDKAISEDGKKFLESFQIKK